MKKTIVAGNPATACFRAWITRVLLVCCTVSCSDSTQPDSDSPKILFIGNSATYYWDTPELVGDLLGAAGFDVQVDQATVGGATLSDQAYRLSTPEKIAETEWDIVVLQPASYYIAFPDAHPALLEPMRALLQVIENSSPEAQIVFTLVWPWEDGITVDVDHYTYFEFQAMMRDGTIAMAEELGVMVAPVGWAWNQVMSERPEVEMFEFDQVHPSRSGAYLQACVYAVAFLRRTLSVPVYGTLEPDQASYFQQVASSIVLDSLDIWNMDDVPPFQWR